MKSIGKLALAIFLGLILFVGAVSIVFGGSLNRVQANEWGCLYGGGLMEGKGLKETIAPGKSAGFTVWDKLVVIPADDRIYAIDKDPTTADFGGQEIIVPAKGTNIENNGIVPVYVPVQARFTINENVCELYSNYLKKYQSEGLNFNGTDNPLAPGGWAKFLNLQMNQALITSIRSELAGTSYVELYTNFSKYPEIQKEVSAALVASLNSSLGGTFFCGPSYTFDGKADGSLDGNGCPPIEIVIKEIKPVDPIFLDNLQKIVANQEAQTVIKSDKEKAIAETEADKEKALAATEADKEKALAETAANQETELAKTEAQKAVETAQAEKDIAVAEQLLILQATRTETGIVKAQAEAAFCSNLAAVGVDCADYFKALNWKPTIITGGSTDLLVDATP